MDIQKLNRIVVEMKRKNQNEWSGNGIRISIPKVIPPKITWGPIRND